MLKPISFISDVVEIPVHKQNGSGALANARCDTFHRAVADITGSKYTGSTCFKPERITIKRPISGLISIGLVCWDLRPSKDVPALINFPGALQPLRVWHRAD